SALLVHVSGGYVEFHFHFFVMVIVVSLYEDWVPFLLAVLWVVLEHGVVGVIVPEAVYNHPDAWAHPWKWAAIHGAFVVAASAPTARRCSSSTSPRRCASGASWSARWSPSRTSPSAAGPSRRCTRARSGCASRRRWKRSASWPAASPTTSIT